jgi:hypothetical protein
VPCRSLSLVFWDSYFHPTFYDEESTDFTKADAEVLAAKMIEMHGAIGLSILVEPPPTTYVKNNTFRTTVGAVLNGTISSTSSSCFTVQF